MNTNTSNNPASDAEPRLQSIAVRLRRRAIAVATSAAAGWAVVVGLAIVLLAVWIDLVLRTSPGFRVLALCLSVLAAAVWLGLSAMAITRRETPRTLVHRLDDAAGGNRRILAAFDLLQPTDARRLDATRNPELSHGLAAMAVRDATSLAESVPDGRVVSAERLTRAVTTLACLGAGLAMFAFLAPRVATAAWSRFSDPFGDHPAFSSIEVRVEPEGAEVLYGRGLELRAQVDGETDAEVELVLESTGNSGDSDGGPRVLPMFRANDGEWRATLSSVTEPLRYHVRVGNARTRRFDLSVVTGPSIESIRVRIEPPAYSRLRTYAGPVPRQGLVGLPGTRVTLDVVSNRPLSGGSLAISGDGFAKSISLAPGEAEREVRGQFVVESNGRVDVHVVDRDGQPSTETFSLPIVALVDEPPYVRLVQPREVSFATPEAALPVVVSADDDYGLSRVQLFRSLNDSRYLPLEMPLRTPDARQCFETVALPLAAYGLRPGDEIKLFARVEDNDPRGDGTVDANGERTAGKGAESRIAVVRIISREQFDRMQRQRDGMKLLLSKYQQARRRLEAVDNEIETLRKKSEEENEKGPVDDERRQQLRQLAERLQGEADALERLSKSKLPYDLDEKLVESLARRADELQRLRKRTEELLEREDLTEEQLREALEQLAKELHGDRERLDQEANEPLELLQRTQPLVRDESAFVTIVKRQRELAERLASLRDLAPPVDADGKRRAREFEAEQQSLREALDRLLDDIEEHADALPEDEAFDELRRSAEEFVTAVRGSGAEEAMVDAETGLAEFDGARGHDGAKRAADILERFLDQCKSFGGEGVGGACRKFQPGLADSLERTMQQLLKDAGMNSGQGSGNGEGQDGYGTRRNSLDNVGLYGDQPEMPSEPRPSNRGGDRQSPIARPGTGGGQPGRTAGTEATGDPARPSTGGTTVDVVPAEYRRRVGRYLQGIADELDRTE